MNYNRSYIVEQTEPKNRTYIMARLSALQYGGFAATPILGSVFVLMGQQLCKSCRNSCFARIPCLLCLRL